MRQTVSAVFVHCVLLSPSGASPDQRVTLALRPERGSSFGTLSDWHDVILALKAARPLEICKVSSLVCPAGLRGLPSSRGYAGPGKPLIFIHIDPGGISAISAGSRSGSAGTDYPGL